MVHSFFHTISSSLLRLHPFIIHSELLHFLHNFTTYSKLSSFNYFIIPPKKVRMQIVFLISFLISFLLSFHSLSYFISLPLYHSEFVMPFTSFYSCVFVLALLPDRHILSAISRPRSCSVSPILPVLPLFSFHFFQLFFIPSLLPVLSILLVSSLSSH